MKSGVFFTSTGEAFSGEGLQRGLNKVADDLVILAHAIRKEDAYASHVTEAVKDKALQDMLAQAEEARSGVINNMTVAQRLNFSLCGECPPLLP